MKSDNNRAHRRSLHSVTANTIHTGPLASLSSSAACCRKVHSPMTVICRWWQHVVILFLHRAWLRRLWRGLALLSNACFTSTAVGPYALNRSVHKLQHLFAARWWRLARQGHGPCPGDWAARRRGDVNGRGPQSLFGVLPFFFDLHAEWCSALHVAPTEASFRQNFASVDSRRQWDVAHLVNFCNLSTELFCK